MGALDFLIDKNTNSPNPEMEYIYRFDMVWTPNKLGGKEIKPGTIVTNVTKKDNSSFEFTNKETGELLCTNYGWSLAENTPKNRTKINKFNKEYAKFKEHERKVNILRENIITLQKN